MQFVFKRVKVNVGEALFVFSVLSVCLFPSLFNKISGKEQREFQENVIVRTTTGHIPIDDLHQQFNDRIALII